MPQSTLSTIWQRLEARFDTMPPQLRKVAAHMRAHPQEVALGSLRGVAAAAGVSPASVTRLLAALDIDSWDSFQQSHRDWLLSGRAAPFSPKAEEVIRGAGQPDAGDALLDRMLAAETRNLAFGLEPDNRAAIRAAADLLTRAPRIGVAGLRSCFPIAHSLSYTLALFRGGIRHFTGLGGVMFDETSQMMPGDALVVISFAPYSNDAVRLAATARESGIHVIAITDSPLSPIARGASGLLMVRNESPAPIASPIGALITTQALALEMLARAGAPAHDAIRRREALMAETAVYHPNV